MEILKPIIDYEDYSISNFGYVKNNKSNKILKNSLNGRGYFQIGLYKNNIRKFFNIHRLLGLHFIENPENKSCLDHIDRNKLNNNINNLRWSTKSENGRNIKKKENCSSIYKNVCYYKKDNKWKTKININKKQIHLGYFETEKKAAQKYNDYIIENNLQEFFILNEITTD